MTIDSDAFLALMRDQFETAKAKNVFQECAEQYDHLSAPHFQLGQYHFSQNSFIMALESFEKALERGPSNPQAYYMKAICEIKIGDITSARNTLLKGREFGEKLAEYRNLMNQLSITY